MAVQIQASKQKKLVYFFQKFFVFYERKQFKQWWSTNPPISNHWPKITAYGIGNPEHNSFPTDNFVLFTDNEYNISYQMQAFGITTVCNKLMIKLNSRF